MECSRCGQEAQPTSKINTGYGWYKDQAYCFACCADLDRQAMQEAGRYTLYLTRKDNDGWYVTNWPGTLCFKASVTVHKYGHFSPFAGYMERRDCWFADDNGRLWHGRSIGDWTELVHCKRLKDTPENRQDAIRTKRKPDVQIH